MKIVSLKIVSIEPTPNPNSMKLNMDERLPEGVSLSYTRENRASAPGYIQRLLDLPGVRSVYQVADFIALERSPNAQWQAILRDARQVFEQPRPDGDGPVSPERAYGEVDLFVQMFRGIPMQVKVISGVEEVRIALPERFKTAAVQAAAASSDFLTERKWKHQGVRYGDPREIGEETAQQVAAVYEQARLELLVSQALERGAGEPASDPLCPAEVSQRLEHPDWRQRYAALDQMEPAPDALTVILKALEDTNASVRRLATVYLGQVGGEEVRPHLFRALKDSAAAVRRAAGDCLSDLGDPAALGPMLEALRDPSKLVRWRAARFLYELGDQSALEALRAARDDPEFEVSLQVRLALERIESGAAAVEPAWKQMTRGL